MMLGTRAAHPLVRLLLAIAAVAVTLSWLSALSLSPGALVGQEPDKEKPAPLDILVIAPHPDDEAIGCAAVMLRALQKKQRVGVVLVTNGDGYPQAAAAVAKKPEARLEPADFLRLARIRQQHSVGALSKIG